MSNLKKGSIESFDLNWKKRPETNYNHWTSGSPKNQIQLAFSQHFDLFKTLIYKKSKKLKILEVGCGRGSLSAFFSNAGHECHLLDISESVIKTAKQIFEINKLNGNFYVGDANNLPFDDNSFDLIFSIGLLEHFENVEPVIKSQIDKLKPNGTLINYIVPMYTDNVQKDFFWINDILKNLYEESKSTSLIKDEVFRSDDGSEKYIKIMKKHKLNNVCSSGTYPLPMVSHSIDFPFTLMDNDSELILVQRFREVLKKRKERFNRHPWLCDEGYGQAFLTWGHK